MQGIPGHYFLRSGYDFACKSESNLRRIKQGSSYLNADLVNLNTSRKQVFCSIDVMSTTRFVSVFSTEH